MSHRAFPLDNDSGVMLNVLPMKICVLTSSFPAHPNDSAAAAGLFVRDFSLQLSEAGHEVTVLTQATERFPREEIEGLDIVWYEWAKKPKALAYLKPYKPGDGLAMVSLFRNGYAALRNEHRVKHFDHVMAMWAVPGGLLALALKKLEGIPFSVWCLGSDIWIYGNYPILRNVVGKVIREADHVYADGIELSDRVVALSGADCTFLPSSRKLRGTSRSDDPDRPAGPGFLFVGRYAEVKGVDVLIDAMGRYKSAGGKGRLRMFGGGPLDDLVRAQVVEKKLEAYVDVGGYINESDYVTELSLCDFFMIPSRLESIPVVFSDALQSGKPVIATRVGDMGTLLDDVPAGLVVPAEDPEALCDAMLEADRRGVRAFAPGVSELAEKFDLRISANSWLKAISDSSRA